MDTNLLQEYRLADKIEQSANPPIQVYLKCLNPECDRRAVCHGRCKRCYQRVIRGTDPGNVYRWTGLPCRCGCGRPARGRSGLSKACYERTRHRAKMRQTIFRRHLGTEWTLGELIEAVNEIRPHTYRVTQAVGVFRRLLGEIQMGQLAFIRPKWRKQ